MAILALNRDRDAVRNAVPENEALYGEHTHEVRSNPKMRQDVRDRAAYVYNTGQFPTHLRQNYTGVLRAVTSYFRKPVSLDGRTGSVLLDKGVVRDLALEEHPMVQAVRERIAEGYQIQPSRGISGSKARRAFWKVFMFKKDDATGTVDMVTVHGDGAVKKGWD